MTSKENDLPKLAKPAIRALNRIGISRLVQFTKVTETEVMQLHGMGPKAMDLIRKALEEKDLSFAEPSERP